MKRRNVEATKLRKQFHFRKCKFAEGIYGSSTFVYVKFLLAWILIMAVDFLLEFRFEFLWPCWLVVRSLHDSFKYQGIIFSLFFALIAFLSDLLCYMFLPIQWLFFAASTYVWIQYVWHTEKGICLPTITMWLLFVYIEASLRLKNFKSLELVRPLAAHCIGYPMVTLGFGFKSYLSFKLRMKKQKEIQKLNEFYMRLVAKALPVDLQLKDKDKFKAIKYEDEATELPVSGSVPASRSNSVSYTIATSQKTKDTKQVNSLLQTGSAIVSALLFYLGGNGSVNATSGSSQASSENERGHNARDTRDCTIEEDLPYIQQKDNTNHSTNANNNNNLKSASFNKLKYGTHATELPGDHLVNNGKISNSNAQKQHQMINNDQNGTQSSVNYNLSSFSISNLAYSTVQQTHQSTSHHNGVDLSSLSHDDLLIQHSSSSSPSSSSSSTSSKFDREPRVTNSSANLPVSAYSLATNNNNNNNNNHNNGGSSQNTNSSQHTNININMTINATAIAAATATASAMSDSSASKNSPSNHGNTSNNQLQLSNGSSTTFSQSVSKKTKSKADKKEEKNSVQNRTASPAGILANIKNNLIDNDIYSYKDELINRLEEDLKKIRLESQQQKTVEQYLRNQINYITKCDRTEKQKLEKFQADNESLTSRLSKMSAQKQKEKEDFNSMEKRLQDERKLRFVLETQLAAEKKQRDVYERQLKSTSNVSSLNTQPATVPFTSNNQIITNGTSCTEFCKKKFKEYENEHKQVVEDAHKKQERISALESERKTLLKYRETESRVDTLMVALNLMEDKNSSLQESLSAETRFKLDLFSALGETRRQLESVMFQLETKDRELNGFKSILKQSICGGGSESPLASNGHSSSNGSLNNLGLTSSNSFGSIGNSNHGVNNGLSSLDHLQTDFIAQYLANQSNQMNGNNNVNNNGMNGNCHNGDINGFNNDFNNRHSSNNTPNAHR